MPNIKSWIGFSGTVISYRKSNRTPLPLCYMSLSTFKDFLYRNETLQFRLCIFVQIDAISCTIISKVIVAFMYYNRITILLGAQVCAMMSLGGYMFIPKSYYRLIDSKILPDGFTLNCGQFSALSISLNFNLAKLAASENGNTSLCPPLKQHALFGGPLL